MTEQLIPEIEKWLALSSEATQPIPRDWWMNKPYKPHFEDNPPPEIENKEEDMEKRSNYELVQSNKSRRFLFVCGGYL